MSLRGFEPEPPYKRPTQWTINAHEWKKCADSTGMPHCARRVKVPPNPTQSETFCEPCRRFFPDLNE